MSLTSILHTKEARAFLRSLIRNPEVEPLTRTVVPPTAPSPQRVGTAFDYALRFGLAVRRLGRVRGVVAQNSLTLLAQPGLEKELAAARRTYERAISAVRGLTATTDLPADVADACYRLAGLDVIFRAMRLEQLRQRTSTAEIGELQALYRVVPWESFRPRKQLLLNPTFGEGSSLVGGADADLVLDDTVIEVKTVKEQKVGVREVRQLVGYALLANAYGIDHAVAPAKIRRAGIYLSRAGCLRTFRLAEAIHPTHHGIVLDYLTTRPV